MNFREMTKEQRDRLVLKILLLMGAVTVLIMFGIRPLLDRIHKQSETISTLESRIHKADRLIRREAEIHAKAAQVRQVLRAPQGTHLPPADNPLLWATQMAYRHAAVQGLEIRAISEDALPVPFWIRSQGAATSRRDAEESPAWRSFAPYSVQITVEASFPEILLLIASLEQEQPLLNISTLSMESEPRNPVIQVARIALQWPRLAVPLPDQVQTFLEPPRREEDRP